MRVQGMGPLPFGEKEQLLSNDMPGIDLYTFVHGYKHDSLHCMYVC